MMSLWWTKKEQLDKHQLALIEKASLGESHLVTGPPGSGKTNVLLRRAQFLRSQDITNALVLTFTRPLTEFIRTGCRDDQDREVFPTGLVLTIESWLRQLYRDHGVALPEDPGELHLWKRALASGARGFASKGRMPRYQALLVDEAQDLFAEEVQLLSEWGETLFFVGDDRQKIYGAAEGLPAVRKLIKPEYERALPFHYRLAPELCRVADRILLPMAGKSLTESCHYDGPRPGFISVTGNISQDGQLDTCAKKLHDQLRVYGDLIRQGDRLGVIVARTAHRDLVQRYLESIPELRGKSQIVRAKDDGEQYDPSIDANCPILIVTLSGCKGLEFRAAHWLFAEELAHHHSSEHYYTAVTRAKTSLDITCGISPPEVLLRAYSQSSTPSW